MYSLGMTLFSMLTGGKSVMLSSELQKDSKFFDLIENEIVNERNHDLNLFNLMKNLLNFDPKKRPSTFEVLKIIRDLIKKVIF